MFQTLLEELWGSIKLFPSIHTLNLKEQIIHLSEGGFDPRTLKVPAKDGNR